MLENVFVLNIQPYISREVDSYGLDCEPLMVNRDP